MTTGLKTLNEIRDRLMRGRLELQHRLALLRAELMGATDSGHLEGTMTNHPADASSDVLLAETDVRGIRELEHELGEYDAALRRIELGTFGKCVDCAEPIDPARLRARPTASRCLHCQSRWEMRSR